VTWAARVSLSAVRKETGAAPPMANAGPEPQVKDDLKSLPVPEVEKRLSSSPDGLSQAEAEAAGPVGG
jgi:hypothetical protein